MSTIYFIGGAPRSGKTTVVQELIKQRPMLAASTDAIRNVAKGILSPQTSPQLFQTKRGAFGSEKHLELLNNDSSSALESELASATETWKAVLDFISYYQRDGIDCAIEGVAILPKLLQEVGFEFKSVFFVNLSDQTEIILSSSRNNPNDWLGKYSEETIKLYCKFNRRWNQYYANEATKYSLPVIEINNEDFESSVKEAVSILLG